MEKIRDYQVSKVYKWENSFRNETINQRFSFNQIEKIINDVWTEFELKYPPLLTKSHKNDKAAGRANRLNVFLPDDGASYQTILHELAHSMTFDIDLGGNYHGADFVGIYIKLLQKFGNCDIFEMVTKANMMGVKYNLSATPIFLNGD